MSSIIKSFLGDLFHLGVDLMLKGRVYKDREGEDVVVDDIGDNLQVTGHYADGTNFYGDVTNLRDSYPGEE